MNKTFFLLIITVLIAGNVAYAGSNQVLPVDVPQTHWVYDSVRVAALDGWLVWDGKDTFKPEADATRGKVAQLLTEAWNTAEKQGRNSRTLPAASVCTATFSDMDMADAKAVEALKQLVAAGVLSGYPDGLMKPDAAVTRQEMAVILSKVCKGTGTVPRFFADQAQIPQWAEVGTARSAAMGMISGYEDGSFRPLLAVTNAEALQMISCWVYPQKAADVISRGQTVVLSDPMTTDILRAINAERSKTGLSSLRINPTLTKVALYKSSEMAEDNYYAHVSPEGEGVEALFTRMGVSGWKGLGENLLQAKGSITAEKAVSVWMQSPDHRAIILTPYTDTGIGLARAADGTTYITQAFATF